MNNTFYVLIALLITSLPVATAIDLTDLTVRKGNTQLNKNQQTRAQVTIQ